MNRLPIIAVLACVFASTACTGRGAGAQLREIESYIQEKPDSALVSLQAIDSASLITRAEKAKYSLLLTMALDKNYIAQKNIAVLDPAVKYYRSNNHYKALTLFYAGIIHYYAEDYTDALSCFSQAADLFAAQKDRKYHAMSLSYIGLTYNACHNKREELIYAERAYNEYQEIKDTAHFQVAMLNVALAYNNNRRYKEADSLLNIVCADSDSTHYTTESAMLLKNDINLRSDTPDPKLSINILEYVRDYGHGLDMEAYCQYAYALLLDGQKERSNKLLERLLAAGAAEDLDCLFILFRIEKNRGNVVKALEYKEAIDSLRDKYVVRMLEQSLFRAQAENASLKELKARTALLYSRVTAALACISLLLLLMAIYLFYRHRNRILQREIDRLIITRDSVLSNLQGMEDVQKAYYLAVLPVFKEIEEFFRVKGGVALERMKADRARNLSLELDRLVDEANKEEFGKFEELLNSRMNGVMEKLRSDFPDFRERDYRILGYSFAGFNDSTIAILLHLNPSSLRSQKSRLKERIKRTDTENAAFLRSFCGSFR